MDGYRVRLSHVSRSYLIYPSPWRKLAALLLGPRLGGKPARITAVRDLSFELGPGEALGLIGPNGAGKSTLLRLVAGIEMPSAGTVEVRGRLGSILELGAGFHPDFTGIENARLGCSLIGLGNDETTEVLPRIREFSGLGDAIDYPIRTYSSGMFLRLAFSVAAHVSPDVLLIDEILSVGDAEFQNRCVKKIDDFRSAGVTLVFASHDLATLTRICDRALLLRRGGVEAEGPPELVCRTYHAMVARGAFEHDRAADYRSTDTVGQGVTDHGTFEALVASVELLDPATQAPLSTWASGSRVTIRVHALFSRRVAEPVIGILLKNRLGIEVFGTNTLLRGLDLPAGEERSAVTVDFTVALPLGEGEYVLTAAVHSTYNENYHWAEGVRTIPVVTAAPSSRGLLDLPCEITWHAERLATRAYGERLEGSVAGKVGSRVEVGNPAHRAFLVDGWYDAEDWGAAGAVRWTRKEARLFLRVPVEASALHVEGSNPDPARWPMTGTIRMCGVELGRYDLAAGPAGTARVPIPSELRGTVVEVDIVADQLQQPSVLLGVDDHRMLGAALKRVWAE